MKSWRETAQVFDEIARLEKAGRASALATLIKVQGSSYRRPGAKLLIRDDGTMLGNVSGGCLENDLRDRALRVIQSGAPEQVHYDTGADENVIWGLGLGCNGKIDIHLQRSPADVDDILKKLAGNSPFEMRAGDFVEHMEPPPNLVVVGAGDDAIPLVRLAAESGFRVWLVDHRAAALRADHFGNAFRMVNARPENGAEKLPNTPATLVVVKNHHINLDRDWTHRFANSPVRYIGLLGPKARRDEIFKGLGAEHRARIYGPIGMDVGADGPEQIALSIVSELLALVAGRTGGHLRAQGASPAEPPDSRRATIHE